MRLTIAIPTYNRNAVLTQNLERLLPQLTVDCRLLIIDNCSDVPVMVTLRTLLESYPGLNYEVIRNRVNVGAVANVMRCFELCDTEYLWALADDDTPRPDAIETIFSHIEHHPQTIFFNFSCELLFRKKVSVTRGVAEFVEKLGSFGHSIFMSTGVYKASALSANLKIGYTYTYSQAPQFATLLASLGSDGQCVLSNRQIVSYNPPTPDQRWSFINLGLGVMTLLELPMQPELRKRLAAQALVALPPLRHFAVHLLLNSLDNGDPRTALYLYSQLCSRLYSLDKSIKNRAKIATYRAMLRFPRAAYAAIDLYKSRKGSTIGEHVAVDPLARM